MTSRILEGTLSDRSYYHLEATKRIDNPDQRISEDINMFVHVSLEFFVDVLRSIIDLAAFSFILAQIDMRLFVGAIIYAVTGTLVSSYVGKPLVKLNFNQFQKEADFRYSLIRLRENAESVAFYGGEWRELFEIARRLARLGRNYASIISTQRNLEFFTTSYTFLVQIIPASIVAPRIFSGEVEIGSVTQAYSAFNHILADLSLIVNNFALLSKFSAGLDRLGEFVNELEQHKLDLKKDAQQVADDNRQMSSQSRLPLLPEQGGGNNVPIVTTGYQKQEKGLVVKLNMSAPFAFHTVSKSDSGLSPSPAPAGSGIGKIKSFEMRPWDDEKQHQDEPEVEHTQEILEIKSLTVYTPDQAKKLVTRLDLKLHRG